MKNLSGGAADGCNYEKEDRYTQARRYAHQAVMYGFLLCFASTVVATVYHYALSWPAPYPVVSLPVVLGTLGGILEGEVLLWMSSAPINASRHADRRLRLTQA